MLTRNMVAIPLEVRKKVEDVIQGGSRTDYANFGGMILPEKQTQILLGGEEVLRGTIKEYYESTGGDGVRGFPKEYLTNFHHKSEIYRYHQGPLETLLKSKTYGSWVTTYDYYEDNRMLKRITNIDGVYSSFVYDDLQRLTHSYARSGALHQRFNYYYNMANNNGPNAVLSTCQYFE